MQKRPAMTWPEKRVLEIPTNWIKFCQFPEFLGRDRLVHPSENGKNKFNQDFLSSKILNVLMYLIWVDFFVFRLKKLLI